MLPSTPASGGGREESLTGEPNTRSSVTLLGGGEGQEKCEATLEDIQELLGAEEVYLELEGGTREDRGDAVIRVSAEVIYLVTYQESVPEEPAQLPGVSDETEGTQTEPAESGEAAGDETAAALETEEVLTEATLWAVYPAEPAEEPVAEEAVSTTVGGDTITITGQLPAGTTVSAVPVDVEVEGMKVLAAYDITLHDADGSEYQPETPVAVAIQSDAFTGSDPEDLTILHVDEEQDGRDNGWEPLWVDGDEVWAEYIELNMGLLEWIWDAAVSFIDDIFGSDFSEADTVSFMADSFSIYVVGDPYVATFQFYDANNELIEDATQILKGSETIQVPAAPEKDGAVFSGWSFTHNGAAVAVNDGALVSELVGALTADVTYEVYPQYGDYYYVTFYDTTGKTVVGTIAVDATDTDTVGEAIDDVEVTLEAGKALEGWSTTQNSEEPNFFANTPVTENISVYPVVADRHVVTFDSQGGSPSVTKVTTNASGTVTAPRNPKRAGFTFDGWYTEADGGTQVDFGSYKPEKDTTLYAQWTASDASYTIQYWIENADDEGYSYVKSVNASGVAGTAITLTENQTDPERVMDDEGAHFAFQGYTTGDTVIKGDNSAIINVYFERMVYTLTFVFGEGHLTCGKQQHTHSRGNGCYDWEWDGILQGHWELTCKQEEHTHDDNCYSGGRVVFQKKYDQNLNDAWSDSTVKYYTDQGYVWESSLTGKYYSYLEKMPGSDLTLTLYEFEGDTRYIWYYWLEVLPGQDTTGLETKNYFGQTYYRDDNRTATVRARGLKLTYQEDYYPITGFDQLYESDEGGWHNGELEFSNYRADLYYIRNDYTLTYQNAGITSHREQVAYGASLANKFNVVPNRPDTVAEGYTFDGWYTTPECIPGTEAANTLTNMPAGNVVVYAKWSAPKVTVTAYYSTDENAGFETLTRPFGEVLYQEALTDVVTVAAAATHHAEGDFLGWYTKSGTSYTDYTFGSVLESDVTLYARWRGDTYTVTYAAGEGSGADYKVAGYALSADARVLSFGDTGLTAPEGQEFSHWTTNGADVIKPGETIQISGNITLTAVYTDEVDVPTVTVTYKYNWPGSNYEDVVTEAKLNNDMFEAIAYPDGTWTAPTGYKFSHWDTQDDDQGIDIDAGEDFRADTSGGNVLYAFYEADENQIKTLKATVDYKLGVEVQTEDRVNLTATVQVLEPDTLSTESVVAKTYTGWKLDNITINGEEVDSLPATVNNGDAVVYNYVVDESATKNLSATVDYKLGDEVQEADHVDLTATVQVLEPDTLSTESVVAKTYTGWKLDSITINGEEVDSLPATVNNGDAVVYNYVVDESATKNLSATVDYKLGDEVQEADHVDLTATVQVLEPDTLSTESVVAKTYTGWKLDSITINGEEVDSLPATVNNGDAVVYNYVVDESATKNLSATVDYKLGDEVQEADHVDLTATVQVLEPDTLSTESVVAKTYTGWKLDNITINGEEVDSLPATVNNGDAVVYNYVVDESATKNLSATVDYKLGDEVQEADHVDLTATVQVLEPDTLSTESVVAKTYTGWKLDNITINGEEVDSLPATVNNGDAVVYNYVVDESATKNLSATVDYKLGDEVQEADHVDLTATVQVLEPDTLSTESVVAKTYTGWKLDSITINGEEVDSLPATVNNGDAVVYNYVVDESATKNLSATVDYKLGDEVQTEDRVNLTATVQVLEPDTLSTEGVEARTYTGWKLDSITINGEEVDSLPATVNNGDAVVYNYVVDESATKNLSATVDYKLGDEVQEADHVDLTATVQVLEPDTLSTESVVAKTYTGWKLDNITINGEEVDSLPATVNNGDAVVYNYVVDESATKNLSATVDYKLGDEVQEADHVDLTATVQVLEPDTLSTESVVAKTYTGWKLDSITINGEEVDSLPATVNNGDAVVYNYVVDESATKNLSATVDYKLGDEVQTEDHVDLTATVQVLEPDTLSTESVVAKTYTGWKLDNITINGEEVDSLPATVNNGDAVVYNYVVDESATKTLSYTVEYYKDGVKVEGDTETVTETVWINSTQTTLTVKADKINTTDKYAGYILDYTDPAEIPATIENNGVIKVYYKANNPDLTVTKSVSESGTASLGDVLTYTITVKNTGNVALSGVTVTDTMWGDKVTSISVDGSPVSVDETGYTIDSLSVGKTVTITYTYTVTADDLGQPITNNVTAQTGDEDGPDDSDTTETEVEDGDYTVTIQPADITVYTGGDAYGGVTDAKGNLITTASGLPEPGYHLELSADVVEWLQEETGSLGAADLSKYLTFTYAVGDVTRKWELTYVGVYDINAETGEPTRYVYSLEPSKTENGEEIPVRILYFVDSNNDGEYDEGETVASDDDILMGENVVSEQYTMIINPGHLTQSEIKAKFTVKDADGEAESIEATVDIDPGTLTIRSTTDEEYFNEIVADGTDVDRNAITAVADGVTYYVNDSAVEVDADRVQLLVDEVSNDAGFNWEMAQDAMDHAIDSSATDWTYRSDLSYEMAYMDLVDTQNGHAVVTADDSMTIYWPMPDDADPYGDFHVVHYTGMDRENTMDESGLDNAAKEILTGRAVRIDGRWYVAFDADSFSPFVLVYEEDNDRPSRPRPDPDDDKDDEDEEPEEDLSGLNTTDHYAYIAGYEDGTVRPDGNITRAEVATIFFRLMTDEYRETCWSTSSGFTDVTAANWYNNAISTTANAGWVSGYPDGTFRPDAYITRAEFATIAARFLSDVYSGTSMFTDISGHWAEDYINRAAAAGWINGYADGTFRPNAYITRAEAVTLINRMLDRAPDANHLLADMVRWPDNPETAWYYADIQEATNSHDYTRAGTGNYEVWTELLANRDWAALEEIWSQANDAPGGEVMG